LCRDVPRYGYSSWVLDWSSAPKVHCEGTIPMRLTRPLRSGYAAVICAAVTFACSSPNEPDPSGGTGGTSAQGGSGASGSPSVGGAPAGMGGSGGSSTAGTSGAGAGGTQPGSGGVAGGGSRGRQAAIRCAAVGGSG